MVSYCAGRDGNSFSFDVSLRERDGNGFISTGRDGKGLVMIFIPVSLSIPNVVLCGWLACIGVRSGMSEHWYVGFSDKLYQNMQADF